MKEFISKWSNWWILAPNRKQLDDAFEKELNELIEANIQDKISSSHSFITPKMPFGGATYDDMVEAEIERLSEKD